jgi:hypothetical protein
MAVSLFVCAPQNFFQAGHSLLYFQQARLPQGLHAVQFGLLFDLQRRAMGKDNALNVFADRHDLIDANAALVSGAVTAVAADSAIRHPAAVKFILFETGREQRLIWDAGRLLALAQAPCQALRRDHDD